MCATRVAQDDPLDMTPIRISAAVALRRWANKKSVIARRLLANDLGLSPDTVSQWLSGERLIPTAHLVRLPELLGFDFTSELFDALMENGERKTLARILHRYLHLIQEEHPHGNRADHCNCRTDHMRGVAVPKTVEV